MPDQPRPIREVDQIRRSCADKLRLVETGDKFTAILGCLLGEDWSTPRIVELQLSSDHSLLARLEGEATFRGHLGAEAELISNIHGIAEVAELDGDEVGYLLGEIARLKRIR